MDALFDVATTPLAIKPCGWCDGPIPEDARVDAIYCSKSCRQASHRFHRGGGTTRRATDPMRVAYADPPYPGKSSIYRDHPDFAGEVDHRELLARLEAEFPDGWALSTSAIALPTILRYPECPADVRVASWHRGERPTRSHWPLSAWEPVIYRGGRQFVSSDAGVTRRTDSLVYVARARTTDPGRVTGAKPAAFAWWLFELLGTTPADDLVDLFPGSRGIERAWRAMKAGTPKPPFERRVVPVDERDGSVAAAGEGDASSGPRDA